MITKKVPITYYTSCDTPPGMNNEIMKSTTQMLNTTIHNVVTGCLK